MDEDSWCMPPAKVVRSLSLVLPLDEPEKPKLRGMSQSGRALLVGTERERKGSVELAARACALRPEARPMVAGRAGSETAPAPMGMGVAVLELVAWLLLG